MNNKSYTFNDLIKADQLFKNGFKWSYIAEKLDGTPEGIRMYYNRHAAKLAVHRVGDYEKSLER